MDEYLSFYTKIFQKMGDDKYEKAQIRVRVRPLVPQHTLPNMI